MLFQLVLEFTIAYMCRLYQLVLLRQVAQPICYDCVYGLFYMMLGRSIGLYALATM